MLEGIDISAHQITTPNLTGRAFVFVRATYGAHGDSRYFVHAANVRKAGKVLGAYHFARPISTGDSVAEQVHDFLLMAREADLLVLDWESDGGNGTMRTEDARAFISAVHAAGKKIGLYTSESHFRDIGQDFDWVANWSREPSRHWDIWQYRGSPLDLDRFDGTVAELLALGAPDVPDTSTPEEAVGPKVLHPEPFIGKATIKGGEDHAAIALDDSSLTWLSAGITKDVTAKGKLAAPWPGHPSGVVYLIGEEWAILLDEDVDVVEVASPLQKTIDEQAAIIAEQKTALAEAAAFKDAYKRFFTE